MGAQNTELFKPSGVGFIVPTNLLEGPKFFLKLLQFMGWAKLIEHELL
jgi:hypothetical protein